MSLEEGSYTGGKPGQQQLQQQQGGGFGQKGDNGDGGGVNNKVKYTMPGVLHFIQHEWSNFELERAHWEIDRAELQVSTYCCRHSDRSCCKITGYNLPAFERLEISTFIDNMQIFDYLHRLPHFVYNIYLISKVIRR